MGAAVSEKSMERERDSLSLRFENLSNDSSFAELSNWLQKLLLKIFKNILTKTFLGMTYLGIAITEGYGYHKSL